MPDFKIAKWAVDQLQSMPEKADKPFFIGFYRPHVPMFAPKKWFDLFPIDQIQLPLIQESDRDDLSDYAIALTNDKHVSPQHEWVKSAGQWEHAVQSYLASIAFADHCLGLVLDALEASPHRDNTIVVLFADHGFHLGEKQRWAKRSIWENGTRVPLIISAPGYPSQQTTSKPAQFLTFFQRCWNWLNSVPSDRHQEVREIISASNERQRNLNDWVGCIGLMLHCLHLEKATTRSARNTFVISDILINPKNFMTIEKIHMNGRILSMTHSTRKRFLSIASFFRQLPEISGAARKFDGPSGLC